MLNVPGRFNLDRPIYYYSDTLDSRIAEYGEMLRCHKTNSDRIERLHFYLNQCSRLRDFHVDGESPVVMGDAFGKLSGMQELAVFYTEHLANILKNISRKYS